VLRIVVAVVDNWETGNNRVCDITWLCRDEASPINQGFHSKPARSRFAVMPSSRQAPQAIMVDADQVEPQV
jgi:hypothetical protein